jgi:hypothetical protein
VLALLQVVPLAVLQLQLVAHSLRLVLLLDLALLLLEVQL